MTLTIGSGNTAKLLNALEDRELPLLQWGITETSFTRDAVLEILEQTASDLDWPGAVPAPSDLLNHMTVKALLLKLPETDRYRTRIAEALRAMVLLRQSFPPPNGSMGFSTPGYWLNGSRLVADFRLHVAPRRYAKRDIPVDDAIARLTQYPSFTAVHEVAARAQLPARRDLAEFQVHATERVFASLTGQSSVRGLIVGAGTGNGKTLAAYLPVLTVMAADTASDGVHTLALYPRTELLKDQFGEAVRSVTAVNQAMFNAGTARRALRLGALYGATPTHPDGWHLTGDGDKAWPKASGGRQCPFLTCPAAGCSASLIWLDRDRVAGREVLCCEDGHQVPQGLIALTRRSMREAPPDLLFTTTEMLSGKSTDAELGPLLGWFGPRRPRAVVLDEVHTYTGVHGAQVALLLRRWKHAQGRRPISVVGLSATLRNAKEFFAQLTDLPADAVEYIEPDEAHLIDEGREYSIAVRADPLSRASLLSTTIQTAMLFGRVLDLKDSDEAQFGSTGFIFTDDLDVTNRLFDILREAEGGQQRRRAFSDRRVLAALRSTGLPQPEDRYRDGQCWPFVQPIGRVLKSDLSGDGLRIGRTSSQDSGFDPEADLVVATPSLEVGVNDERVGMVMQHKAPRDAAAFIQRRGRAGRRRSTRPLTIAVLSDYGRDRLAYQAYDNLFAPELQAQDLPVGNRYVQKIQGAHVLLDWCAAKLRSRGYRGDVRKLLTVPRSGTPDPAFADERTLLANLLDALLMREDFQQELETHISQALHVRREEAVALLWEPPRALLTAVVPTCMRRLRREWQTVGTDPFARAGQLLPDFVTTSLFSPLNVPEVTFTLPFAKGAQEAMPIASALREAVPGRVSRRYGNRDQQHRTWIAPPPSGTSELDLGGFVRLGEHVGKWRTRTGGEVEVYRPTVVDLADPDPDIDTSSQGIPRWDTEILAPPSGLTAASVPAGGFARHVTNVGFATHACGNPALVRRMTTGADLETRTSGQVRSEVKTSVSYTYVGQPAALGFELAVDGMCVEIAGLDLVAPRTAAHLATPAWKHAAFVASLASARALDGLVNSFQRTWLTRVYLTCFAVTSLENPQSTPEQIRQQLAGGAWKARLSDVLNALYRDSSGTAAAVAGPMIDGLTTLAEKPEVTDCIDQCAAILIGAAADDLAQQAHKETFAAGLLAAVQRYIPNSQDNDLIVDIDVLDGDGARIWLTETAMGGLGVIERFSRRYADDPRRFWSTVGNVLGPSEYEYVDDSLTRLLGAAAADPTGAVAEGIKRVRDAADTSAARSALDRLRRVWASLGGGHPQPSAVKALNVRLLRPGTTAESDAFTHDTVAAWKALETHLGFEVEAGVIAYAVHIGLLPAASARRMTADQAYSMLWPRGAEARNTHINHYQPYAPCSLLDRLLAQAAHRDAAARIDVTESSWMDSYREVLAKEGGVELTAPDGERDHFAQALRQVPALEVEHDVLRVYGILRRVSHDNGLLCARIELKQVLS